MGVNLCIDWGNSRVKTGLFDQNGRLTEKGDFSATEVQAAIQAIIDRHQPAGVIVCSVNSESAGITEMLRGQIKHIVILDNNTSVPIMNAYHSPETLGPDRLALVVGAYSEFPDKNNLVVCLGTCITYNFIQKNKAFRGGAISPGLHMRLQALHNFTDRLPEVPVAGDLLLLGYDTETSMRSGAVNGMACEIDGMVQAFASQYPDFNAILTGGDEPYFGSKLKNKIFADPNLLLKGLNLILKHNVPYI